MPTRKLSLWRGKRNSSVKKKQHGLLKMNWRQNVEQLKRKRNKRKARFNILMTTKFEFSILKGFTCFQLYYLWNVQICQWYSILRSIFVCKFVIINNFYYFICYCANFIITWKYICETWKNLMVFRWGDLPSQTEPKGWPRGPYLGDLS